MCLNRRRGHTKAPPVSSQTLPSLSWLRPSSSHFVALPGGAALNRSPLTYVRVSPLFPGNIFKHTFPRVLGLRQTSAKTRWNQRCGQIRRGLLHKFVRSFEESKDRGTRLPWPPWTGPCSSPWCARFGHSVSLHSHSTANLRSEETQDTKDTMLPNYGNARHWQRGQRQLTLHTSSHTAGISCNGCKKIPLSAF